MDAMEAILSRRSIRKYSSRPVPHEVIDELLRAAMSAPSAGNEQPWHFVVIDDREILSKIPQFHPDSERSLSPPAAILVCGNLNEERFKGMGFWVLDCSASTMNLLIAVHAKGLGAVWSPVYPDEQRINSIRKLLGIPEHVVPFSLIPIGYPAEKKSPSNRYDASKIRHNHW